MKLQKKPTVAQRAILERMARGAEIVLHPPGHAPRRALTDARGVRAVATRTLDALKFNGWIWSGPGRPCLVITAKGRATLR